MSAESVNVALMKAMGSKSGEYDPMPPAQYEAFLDVAESEENRIWAAILKRTIGRASDGSRSAFAREQSGRITQQVDLAAECQMSEGNVSDALRRLEAKGKIRRETKPVRIWLRADVPAPNHVEELLAKDRRSKVHVQITLNTQVVDLLRKLQTEDPEQFRHGAARIVAAQEWGAQVKADAIAWARERETEVMQQVFTELGYTKAEKRGAKKKPRPAQPHAFQVSMDFEEFSVHNSVNPESEFADFSVQERELIAYRKKNDSVQNPYPYGPEFRDQSSASSPNEDVDAGRKTSKAGLKQEQASAAVKNEIKTEIQARLQRARLTALGAVQIDAGTLQTLANDLARLQTAGDVREVLDVLEERARELKSGVRVAEGWGYIVKTVRGEVEKKLPANLKTQMNNAAAGKTMR